MIDAEVLGAVAVLPATLFCGVEAEVGWAAFPLISFSVVSVVASSVGWVVISVVGCVVGMVVGCVSGMVVSVVTGTVVISVVELVLVIFDRQPERSSTSSAAAQSI